MPQPTPVSRAFKWYRLRLQVAWLNVCVWLQRGRVNDPHCPLVVSLTSHGTRIAKVHVCLQSIAMGSVRPRRLILWLNGAPDQQLPAPLQHLQRRGLELRYVPNYGPHTKYFPYVSAFADDGHALVTADDDGIYAENWLHDLLAAHQAQPGVIHCHWAKEIALDASGRLLPYHDWPTLAGCAASPRHFALGVSGVVYPPAFLQVLRGAGDAFMQICPKADDIWLHAMALRHGFAVRQIKPQRYHPRTVPFTQDIALFLSNQLPSGNDAQITATYTDADLALLANAGQHTAAAD